MRESKKTVAAKESVMAEQPKTAVVAPKIRGAFFDKLALIVTSVTAVALPFIVLPVGGLTLDGGKKFFLSFGVLTAFLLWLVARIQEGRFKIPRGFMSTTAILAMLAALLATVFSVNFLASFWGTGIETGTMSALIIFMIAGFLASVLFQDHTRLHKFFIWFWYISLVFFVLQIVRLIAPGIFAFDSMSDVSLTLLGKWYDWGIFLGLGLMLSMVALESGYRGVPRKVLWMVYIGSLIGTMLVNFNTAWTILLIIGLGVVAYRFVIGWRVGGKKFSLPGIFVVVCAILFLWLGAPGQPIGKIIAALRVPTVYEVRPSFGVTLGIANQTLAGHPILGGGPNRFVNQWYLHRPTTVNETPFWGTDFNVGYGLLPMTLVTMGYLGFAFIVLFLASFIWVGLKTISDQIESPLCIALVLSWLGALYLWIFTILYIPDTVLLTTTALFTGVFMAARASLAETGNREFSYMKNRRLGFLVLLVILLLVVATGGGLFVTGKKMMAINSFHNGVRLAAVAGDVAASEAALKKAIALDPQDIYYRTLSELDILRINAILTQKNANADTVRAQFQAVSADAITAATKAVETDPTRHANWLALGAVYQALVPAHVQGAYDMAKKSYERALSVYPESPVVSLAMAKLETFNGNQKLAREYIAQALKRKSNYTDAIYFLSQLEVESGNIDSATRIAEQAFTLSPTDVGIAFQLGLLKYTKKDYVGAIGALEKAIAIMPNYSNARYFLGLSYAKTGRPNDAIKQFNEILKYNPDNSEVQKIIANITAGKNALEGIAAPEKRATPPVKGN